MKTETIIKKIPLPPTLMLRIKDIVDNYPVIKQSYTEDLSKEIRIRISRRTSVSRPFEFKLKLFIQHKGLDLDVAFGFERDKQLRLMHFGYYKGDQPIGTHYTFNSKGDLVKRITF